jgi:rare lipoprotein A
MSFLKSVTCFVLFGFIISGCGLTKRTVDDENEFPRNNEEFEAELLIDDELPLIEDGTASWYGPNFHGKLTANGEVYDMDGITAAHRTLPFETILLVENLDNGKTVQVRVNDRGPYAKDRIIDLSKGAAKKIDMIGPGTARINLYLLKGDLENARITDIKVPTYTVQLGSYNELQQAEDRTSLIEGSRVEVIGSGDSVIYRVYFGSYIDPNEARIEMQRLSAMGFNGFVKQIQN